MAVLLKDVYAGYDPDSARVFRDVNIYVESGLVSFVGENIPPYAKTDHVVDCKNKIVMPGFSNTHTHLGMTILRGYADDLPLKRWLNERIWPVERKLNGEQVYSAARLAGLELLYAGVTAVCDMYFFEDKVAEAITSMGIRILATPPVFTEGVAGSSLADALHIIERGGDGPLLRWGIGPHSTYSCDKETLAKVFETAERRSLKIHIHVGETRWSQLLSETRYGKREVEVLEEVGPLTERLIAAHCVWVTKGEVEVLAKRGANVVFCPVSNAKLAEGGVAPIPEMLERGVNVCFGTDGAASNNSLSVHQTMKFGSLIVKNHRWDPTLLDAGTCVKMATTNGYRAMGFPVNGLRVGCAADLIAIPLKAGVRSHPEASISSRVVYSDISVSDVLVNGEPLLVDARPTRVDEQEILDEFEKAADSLVPNELSS